MNNLLAKFLTCTGVSTDTRAIKKDNLFFALKGDNFNGNAYALKALESGAKYAVIDEEEFKLDDRFILVSNGLKALQELATAYRKTFNIPVIGLTGSNGKTTNKELLNAGLSTQFKVHATFGNLNNHIGVPLTLLRMPKGTQIAIIEMGANHQKEIAELCAIAQPTHGLITNIGKAHLEGFGGIEGVKKGKGELIDYLNSSNGQFFVPPLEKTVQEIALKAKNKIELKEELDLISESPEIEFKLEQQRFTSMLSGYYNFSNIHNAFSISQFFKVSPQKALEAIATYAPENNRSQVIKKDSNEIFLDAYNANPSSMEASISNFINYKTTKDKVVLLGDMFEIGETTEKEHEKLGELIAKGKFTKVILFGSHIKAALVHLPMAYFIPDKFSLHNWFQDHGFKNTAFLIKGSRGVSLETVLPFITEKSNYLQ